MEKNEYAAKQKNTYEHMTSSDDDLIAVVGAFESHQAYPYEKYLTAKLIGDTKEMVALDFGCAGGRMILRMSKLFKRVDGVDISAPLIEGAKRWCKDLANFPRFFVNTGADLAEIDSDFYDLVYCTVSFHHIANYENRVALIKEFLRVLKPGGQIALQLLYSDDPTEYWRLKNHVSWLESPNIYKGTNGCCDVRITPKNINEVQKTFEDIGFKNFSYELQEPPYGGVKEQTHWIFLYAEK